MKQECLPLGGGIEDRVSALESRLNIMFPTLNSEQITTNSLINIINNNDNSYFRQFGGIGFGSVGIATTSGHDMPSDGEWHVFWFGSLSRKCVIAKQNNNDGVLYFRRIFQKSWSTTTWNIFN